MTEREQAGAVGEIPGYCGVQEARDKSISRRAPSPVSHAVERSSEVRTESSSLD